MNSVYDRYAEGPQTDGREECRWTHWRTAIGVGNLNIVREAQTFAFFSFWFLQISRSFYLSFGIFLKYNQMQSPFLKVFFYCFWLLGGQKNRKKDSKQFLSCSVRTVGGESLERVCECSLPNNECANNEHFMLHFLNIKQTCHCSPWNCRSSVCEFSVIFRFFLSRATVNGTGRSSLHRFVRTVESNAFDKLLFLH